jgi:AcrR family transcriptional regulator
MDEPRRKRMPPKPDVSAQRRAQIIEAALACFTRKGYNNTTMDDIVAESGLSKGSLYWYFESKDQLFAESLLSVFIDVGQEVFAALERCTTASDKLRAIARATVDISRRIEGFFGLFLEFLGTSSRREEAGTLWLDMLVEYKDIVVEIIEQGIQSGEFRPVDAEQLAWAMMAAYDGLAAYLMFMPDLDLDRISEVFAEMLLNGLTVRQ